MKRAILILSALLFACSSGGAGNAGLGGGGTGGAGMTRLCDSLCTWYARCERAESGCSAKCSAESAAYAGKWSPEFVSHAATCFDSLACNQSDDACIANFAAVDPAYPNIPEVTACLAKRTECSSSSWADDYCHSIAALTASARAAADACRARPCAEIATCLRSAGAFNY